MARAPKSAPPPPASRPAPSLERRLAYGLALLLAVAVPFLFSRATHESFRLPKLLASEALTLGSIFLLSLAWARKRLAEPPRETLDLLLRVLGPIVAVAALGLFAGDHPSHTRQTLAALAIGVAGCAAWALGFDRGQLGRLLAWTVVPGVGLALVGIGQYHQIFHPFAFERGAESARLAVTSLAGNAGELGAYLLLPALVAQWRLRADPGRRPLWIAALALLVYGQIASQTLTALAALVAGSAVFWLLAVPARRRGLVVGGALVATLVVALAAPPVRNRLATISDGLTVGRVNAALSGRLDGWRVAGHLFAAHPVAGVGLGGFAPEFAPARLALQDQGVQFYPGHKQAFFANAHNEYLEWAAEAGLLGLAALVFALGSLLRRLGGLPTAGHERAFGMAALVSLALLALAYFPFRLALLAYPILLLVAWLMRAATEPAAAERTP